MGEELDENEEKNELMANIVEQEEDFYKELLKEEDEEVIEVDDFHEKLDEDQKVIEFMTELVELVEDFYEKLINVHVQQATEPKEKLIKIKKEKAKAPPVEAKPNIVHSANLELFANIIPAKEYGKQAKEKNKLKNAFKEKEDPKKIEKQNTFFKDQYQKAQNKAIEEATRKAEEEKFQTRYISKKYIDKYREEKK